MAIYPHFIMIFLETQCTSIRSFIGETNSPPFTQLEQTLLNITSHVCKRVLNIATVIRNTIGSIDYSIPRLRVRIDSPREALITLAAGLLTLSTLACSMPTTTTSPENPSATRISLPLATTIPESQTVLPTSTPVSPDSVYEGSSFEYGGRAKELIDSVERDYGINIISPVGIQVIENVARGENIPWTVEEIERMVQVLSQLPPAYFSHSRTPKQIIIMKLSSFPPEAIATGGYYSRRMYILLTEDFSFSTTISNPEINQYYPTHGDVFEAVIVEELTHSLTEGQSIILDDWCNTTGWELEANGEWKNADPERIPSNHMRTHPTEDMAGSAGLMFTNPGVLSQNRQDFFHNNSNYARWP